MSTVPKRATYQDLLDAPPLLVAEILRGTLVTHPRPRGTHAGAASVIGEELGPRFRRGRGGPGGWVILDEPELHLGEDVLVPDLAGWRRPRFTEPPDSPYFSVSPDWVCEVLSPSTQVTDRTVKVPIFASASVGFVWLVDPEVKTLEELRLDGKTYRLVGAFSGDQVIRAEPFDAVEFELGLVWNW